MEIPNTVFLGVWQTIYERVFYPTVYFTLLTLSLLAEDFFLKFLDTISK